MCQLVNLPASTKIGESVSDATLAQSVEQLPRKEQVRSSILLGGSRDQLHEQAPSTF
jgi:hypothetical protein